MNHIPKLGIILIGYCYGCQRPIPLVCYSLTVYFLELSWTKQKEEWENNWQTINVLPNNKTKPNIRIYIGSVLMEQSMGSRQLTLFCRKPMVKISSIYGRLMINLLEFERNCLVIKHSKTFDSMDHFGRPSHNFTVNSSSWPFNETWAWILILLPTSKLLLILMYKLIQIKH